MWRSELDPAYVKMEREMAKDTQRVGSKEEWY
jgi:hypothetical protein